MQPAEKPLPLKSQSYALRELGVRSWRGALILAAQFAAGILVVYIALKVAGLIKSPWLVVLLAPLGPAFGIFVVVSLYALAVTAMHTPQKGSEP